MKVYAVFKTGVYRHECGGIFKTIEEAEFAAEHFLRNEFDNYHEFDIVSFEVGEMSKIEDGEIQEILVCTMRQQPFAKGEERKIHKRNDKDYPG